MEFLQALRDNPKLATVYTRLALLYTTLGRLDDALDVLVQAHRADALWPLLPATEIAVRFCRREFDAAVACGKEALDLHPYLQLGVALLQDALGNRDQAFQELERAHEEGSIGMLILDVDPKADPQRGDPRFERLRNKLFGAPLPFRTARGASGFSS